MYDDHDICPSFTCCLISLLLALTKLTSDTTSLRSEFGTEAKRSSRLSHLHSAVPSRGKGLDQLVFKHLHITSQAFLRNPGTGWTGCSY